MLNSIWMKRRSVILTWLFSYVAILLLPILIGVFVYRESNAALEDEIHRANDALLKQVREIMDNEFESVLRLNTEITWNTKIQDLMYTNKLKRDDYQYSLYQVAMDFKLYKTFYPQITDFYVYYSMGDTGLMPGLVRSGKDVYEQVHNSPNFSYQDWLSMLTSRKEPSFVPMVYRSLSGSMHQSIAHISYFASNTDTKPEGAVVILVDESKLLTALQNVQLFNGGEVLVLNKENQILLSSLETNQQPVLTNQFASDEQGFFHETYNGQDSVFYYISSKKTNLKFVTIMPSALVWQKANNVRWITYISIVLSILGGSLLTFFFLKKNYNPIRQLILTFKGESNEQLNDGSNEFQFIQHMISNTVNEKEQANIRLKQQNHLLRSNFMNRLLKGRVDNQIPIEDALPAFEMHFDSDEFAVLLFYVEANELFFSSISGKNDHEKAKLLQFIVSNVVEDIMNTKHIAYMTEIDDMLACMINFRDSGQAGRLAELRQMTEEAQQFLKMKFQIELTVSISNIHPSIVDLSIAYKESVDAMEYKLIMGRKEIISFHEIQNEALNEIPQGYYYPLQVEQQLINFLKIGEYDRAKETLDTIVDRNLKINQISLPLARCLMFDLVSTMVKALHEIGDTQEESSGGSLKEIEKLTACETMQDMHEQLTEMLKEVCSNNLAKRKSTLIQIRHHDLETLAQNIVSFIQENYHDADMNISLIGLRFDMKSTYLSKLFREQTGEGLLDYINKVRIVKAKELIENQNITLNEIASLVGFSDVNALIRIFKKYEGVTPGKYKEMYLK
ncbi:AraC family transcriptional regulator [Paenibacillus sp. CGMCC 1.16610]|uniref:AraC family transcriptional regulator n=1 Tax=Paenibacillus TaxID=44249 RepID=UPI0015EE8461|nr:AraC family transcriptional regulator [Paenibacillus sp. CGMCC 1.16610]MBA2938742.1 AraC family transcriptional regulator [Paenibacillus sp. CGMCC 1.16610]